MVAYLCTLEINYHLRARFVFIFMMYLQLNLLENTFQAAFKLFLVFNLFLIVLLGNLMSFMYVHCRNNVLWSGWGVARLKKAFKTLILTHNLLSSLHFDRKMGMRRSHRLYGSYDTACLCAFVFGTYSICCNEDTFTV